MLVAIDGFNAFFNEKTDLKTEDRVKVTPQQVSIVQTGLSAVLSDWVMYNIYYNHVLYTIYLKNNNKKIYYIL